MSWIQRKRSDHRRHDPIGEDPLVAAGVAILCSPSSTASRPFGKTASKPRTKPISSSSRSVGRRPRSSLPGVAECFRQRLPALRDPRFVGKHPNSLGCRPVKSAAMAGSSMAPARRRVRIQPHPATTRPDGGQRVFVVTVEPQPIRAKRIDGEQERSCRRARRLASPAG